MLPPLIEPEEVACELQRILDSPEFRRNRNASAFLKFVVEEELAGRGDRLKAFTIATLALQRDDSFDPQNNSIVRVQATRVRHMLDSHYAGAGVDDPVHITLPRGSYVPVFAHNSQVRLRTEEEPRRRSLTGRLKAVAVALVCGLAGAAIGIAADRHWISLTTASVEGTAPAFRPIQPRRRPATPWGRPATCSRKRCLRAPAGARFGLNEC